ncbi:MAG: DUF3488 and transglutaminase-like domain-containing protein [Wenzhouxiangellaceae bacterium]|nr:DUF3488 and transglutaminase-like domain-containing protein [Wenzhouxiangellaceae bacterium]
MTQKPSQATFLLVIGAFGFAVFPHLLAMPASIAGLIVLAIVWRAIAAMRQSGPPQMLLRAALTFLGLGLVVMNFGTLWGRRAATVLLCVMLAAKLMETFRLRDARVVAALCFFLIAIQFLFSQKLVLFGYLLVGCWLATAALIRIQGDDDDLDACKADSSTNPGVLSHGLMLMALAIPFALVLFTLFPRLATPLWGMPDNALDGKTGLSDEMSPGNIANLFADDSPAFRVEFDAELPAREDLYWRGPVLWRFDGRTWRRLFYSERAPERLPEASSAPLRYSVQLEPSEQRWLFSLDYPATWPDEARLTADFELLAKQPVTTLMSYQLSSQPDFVDTPELSGVLRRMALELPAGSNPRSRAHALELRRRHADDRALVDAVLEWFNQDEFFYSLETAPLGRHGADEFLFDLRTGYCEYYASAFVVLMRAAGIPARIVTGYQGGYWQRSDNYLLVRQSDAHAWAEVWFDDQGWTRIDPTAAVSPSRILGGARNAVADARNWLDAEWLYQLRNQYDRLQHLWNQRVLGFDALRQQNLLSGLGLGNIGTAGQAALVIALAAIVLGPLVFVLAGLINSSQPRGRLERSWDDFRHRLEKAGLEMPAHETPMELAQRASGRLKNGHELQTLAERYCALRYGLIADPIRVRVQEKQFRAAAMAWRACFEPLNSRDGPID